ncbi:MAG TPA: hypothetical protein VGK20_00225 [Candidatus Binatia bacterium]
MKSLFGRSIAIAITCIAAVPAAAQYRDDHLTCYKVHDPVTVKGTADIDTAAFGLAPGCTVSKAALLCSPSATSKVVTSPVAASLGGPRSGGEQICYKVKCPAPTTDSQLLVDEFGSRTLDKLKTSLVCGPAAAGAGELFTFQHYARGLAQIAQTSTADGPTLHVRSLDGFAPDTPDAAKSAPGENGGSGVVVVLNSVDGFGVRVRDDRDSRASLGNTARRAGAALDVRGHNDESDSETESISVAVGSSGVSTTAYFPRLQRLAGAAGRTGIVTCSGAVSGQAGESVPGDPRWSWTSPVWPDSYKTGTTAMADSAEFQWENGCVDITSPDGTVLSGDRLVISLANSTATHLKRVTITGSGGLAAFALKDETSN